MLEDAPVLGVCGFSGSGKTTLIESILPVLRGKGLRVAVLKHDVHGINVDTPGKDSDRLFRAGADVLLQGTDEELLRLHGSGEGDLQQTLRDLASRYDMVLVEGHKGTPLRKLWLASSHEPTAPPEAGAVERVLDWGADRKAALLEAVEELLRRVRLDTPLMACVAADTVTDEAVWGKLVEILRKFVEEVVAVGGTDKPCSVSHMLHLPVARGLDGDAGKVLTAMRWAPGASWLVVLSGHDRVTPEAVNRVLNARGPGIWLTLPERPGGTAGEPELAHFDPRARSLIEGSVARGGADLARLAGHEKAIMI